MHSYIRPNVNVVLKLPSGMLKIVEIIPNTSISIGKFGSFPASALLGRPYHLTFEILDKEDGQAHTRLRIVPATELHTEVLSSNYETPSESRDERVEPSDGVEFDVVGENGELIMRSNRLTVDNPSRQQLSMEEIEELKKARTGSGKDIIAKIMASHMAIEEKTSFSLAKYTLRKSKKYMKRFEVLPLDVSMLTQVLSERDEHRIMELREETLGLIGSWLNIHASGRVLPAEKQPQVAGVGRWLVVDDSGGLIVASLAERMGILYPQEEELDSDSDTDIHPIGEPSSNADPDPMDMGQQSTVNGLRSKARGEEYRDLVTDPWRDLPSVDGLQPSDDVQRNTSSPSRNLSKMCRHLTPAMSATSDTITVLHANAQPNLSILKYFSFNTDNHDESHPFHVHLKTISWLQLLHPEEDSGYTEPEKVPDSVLSTWKSGKRSTYYRKRRRWERIKGVVDDTRRGGFDGIVIASSMEPATILKHTVPLLRGAAQVVVYSPTVEPLTELMDMYSRDYRTAYIKLAADPNWVPNEEDFPLNPTLLLAPMLQTARARHWQVLPGRTHPLMTSKGGAEGYLFTATRVLPAEGKVEARGKFAKRRKLDVDADADVSKKTDGAGSALAVAT